MITDPDELRRKHRVNGANAATLTACAGTLWPYKLVAFILEKLIKEDRLNLQTKTPVTKLEPLSIDPSATVGVSPLRQILHTPRGAIKARHVILATNGYTSHLLPEFSDLIVPERGTMTALLPPAGSLTRLADSYGFVGAFGANPTHDEYLNQRPMSAVPNPKGHLMFGGGYAGRKLNMIGETDDGVLDEGAAAYLRAALLKLLVLDGGGDGGEKSDEEGKRVDELEATHEWSGIWGTSRDHHPWVGAVPDRPGVWLAGGYSGAYILTRHFFFHPYIPFHSRPILALASPIQQTTQTKPNQTKALTIPPYHPIPKQATACPTRPSAPKPSSKCSSPLPPPLSPQSKPPS